MDAEALLAAARNLAIVSVFLLLLQGWWWRVRAGQQARKVVNSRMFRQTVDVEKIDVEPQLSKSYFDRLQLKAGLNIGVSTLTFIVFSVLAAALLVWVLMGGVFALLTPLVAASVGVLLWSMRYQRRRRTIFESMPEIIDDVIRGIDASRSLEHALVNALTDAPEVFTPLTFRLRSAVESGRDYTQLMDDFAVLYRIPPLSFVAVALRTASHYGSAIRPVLKKVSRALRSQQEMRREFMAATSETRFTAGVFATLPLALGGGLIAMNEGFRDVLLGTETGNNMLMTAVALIAIGAVIVFRMVQGVGRV